MNILCIIDSLGSGGAQRQLVNLACGLKAKGHDVEFFVYNPRITFFRPNLYQSGIPVNQIRVHPGFSFTVVRTIARLLQQKKPDALISFLPSPNIYTVLAFFYSSSKAMLILNERSSDAGFLPILRYILYSRSHHVVVNSFDQQIALSRYSWLKHKTSVIYNGYNIEKNITNTPTLSTKGITLIAVGRNTPCKNGFRLLQALLIFKQKNGYMPNVSWVGRQEQDRQSLLIRAQMDQLISSHSSLDARWHWLGERSDVPQLLAKSDALIHVSLYEGLPNVVCEAFIAAKPAIVSAVCDNPLLVEEGVRGHLCDPLCPESICEAIERFCSMTPEERQAMGRNARRFAEEHLTLERMVNDYEALLN